jgi:hypothetical protein
MYISDGAQAIMVLGVCATVAISVVSIGRAYVRSIEAQRKPSQADLDPNVQERMTRIEQAVDAIAIEVERMSEGQRFTTRLLAEQFGEHDQTDVAGSRPVVRRHGTDGAGGDYGR